MAICAQAMCRTTQSRAALQSGPHPTNAERAGSHTSIRIRCGSALFDGMQLGEPDQEPDERDRRHALLEIQSCHPSHQRHRRLAL